MNTQINKHENNVNGSDDLAIALRKMIDDELIEGRWKIENGSYVPPDLTNKDDVRNLHRFQRIERADRQKLIFEKFGNEILKEFANGEDVAPENFAPELVKVESGSWETKVFRFSTLLWSIPVSQGYGRRMRYLVRDRSNGKWVGLFALGDPVFNLNVRDSDIGWNAEGRRSKLYNVMDAYVLGAIPPYNRLLGGKFIALAASSNNVRYDFFEKYKGRTTIIQGREKDPYLVLITTTSALGRSSIYNRLKLPWETDLIYRPIGYSSGWGHFHISDKTFSMVRDWLVERKDPYANGHQYGDGPNWRLRTLRKAFDLLGFNGQLLRHGIKREIFLVPLAQNYREYLLGKDKTPLFFDRDFEQITQFFKNRWMIPRSQRVNDWREWTIQDTLEIIQKNCGSAYNLPLF